MKIEKSLSLRVWTLKGHVHVMDDAVQHIEILC